MKKYAAFKGPHAPTIFYSLPELHYPPALNAVEVLLEGAMRNGWHARTAYLHRGRAITYGELRDDVHRCAAALRRLDVKAGDAVLLRLEDGPELVCAILAAQAIGAIAVPTYVQLRSDGLAMRVKDCGAKVALVSQTLREAFEPVPTECPGLRHTVIVPEDPTGRFRSMRDLLGDAAPAANYAVADRDDVALILYTSGSSGQPKGTLHNHADLLAICDTYARYSIGMTETDIVAGPAAIPFALGIGMFVYFPLRFGAAAVLDSDKTPETLIASAAHHGATILVGVSTYFSRLSRLLIDRALKLPSVRMALCGGEPLPLETTRWCEQAGLTLEQFLGTTETLHVFIGIRHGRDTPKPDAIGTPVPGYEVSVRDAGSFEPVPPGQHGLLCVRGPTGTCYLNREDVQRTAVREGWCVFPDIVFQDDDGFIHYIARDDDIIVSGGHSISPVEVEQILMKHPSVAECACVSGRDHAGDRPSVVTAFVVIKDAVTATDGLKRELQDFFKTSGPPYMYPRRIEFMPSLPRTLNGKILRSELRKTALI